MDKQPSRLRRRIFQLSVGLVLFVVSLQLALFAIWEFLMEDHSVTPTPTQLAEGQGPAIVLEPPTAHQVEEILVLSLIGVLTIPLFMVLIHFVCKAVFTPIEQMAATADEIRRGNIDARLPAGTRDDEINTLANMLNDAFDRYQDQLTKAEQFSADASHQLRTPLAVIRTSGELALTKASTPEEYREILSNVLEETHQLEHIVEQLLLLTRLTHKNETAKFSSINPADIVRRVEERFSALFEDRGVTLRQEIRSPAHITGNPALITEAVTNLTLNALEATPAGGQVVLKAFNSEAHVIFEVDDSGCGITPENQQRVFDRFYRNPGNANKGSGLGLAIVQAIAELHGATPSVTSEPGQGSQFQLRFPLADYQPAYEI